jgi:hypothetical protein
MRTISQDTLDTFDRGDSLLVLSPTFSGTEPATCSDLLSESGERDQCVLCVTLTRSPEDHLINWRRHGNVPGRAAFVDVDASARSNGLSDESSEYDSPDDVDTTVDRVPSPENLTRLGVRTTNRLEALNEEVTGSDVAVCFDSVTALLQYVDVDQAFKFLHVLTDRCSENGVRAHFHMDPGAHDEETIETLRTLFDGVWAAED